MPSILYFILISIPILELTFLIQLGGIIGVLPTLIFLVLSFIIGIALIRYAGLSTLVAVQQRLNQGVLPAQELVNGVFLLVAGVLFLLPGFISDCLALLLILPGIRTLLRRVVVTPWMMKRGKTHASSTGFSEVVEGEFRQEPQEKGSAQGLVLAKLPDNQGGTVHSPHREGAEKTLDSKRIF